MKKDKITRDMISIVVPTHNEAEGIRDSVNMIMGVMTGCSVDWEIIVVDDGSSDSTYSEVSDLSKNDARIKAVRFTRNFGKEAALLAGLQMAFGDAVITIDADLQHPPKLIPTMIEKWKCGAQIVDAVKRNRDQDSLLVKLRASLFNKLLSYISGIDVQNSSDFKLLDRVVVDTITKEMPERSRFYRGLVDWVGYNHEKISFDIEPRAKGEGKWSILSLIGLATTAIVSFTSTPLRIVTFLGFVTLVFGFGIALETLWSWFHGQSVSGFATIIITLLLLGSFIMISLGVMGEYIAKVYDEIKSRPSYLVAETIGLSHDSDKAMHKGEKVCASCGRPLISQESRCEDM